MTTNAIRALIVVAPLLSACPYDASSAGLVKVDGGYVAENVGIDGGLFFADIDAAVPDQLSKPPTMEQLCMMWIGDVNNQTDYPNRTGTWVEDVKGIIGQPPRNGEMHDKESATLTYLWKGEDGTPAGITLSFEHVLFQYQGDNGGPPGGCFEPSLWLNGIQMRDGTYPSCWRWELGEPGLMPCKDCLTERLTNKCLVDNPKPQECFVPGVQCSAPESRVKVAECVATASDPQTCF